MQNLYLVGVEPDTDSIVILHPGVVRMTKDQALNVAAWIVTLADPLDQNFPAMLREVRNT